MVDRLGLLRSVVGWSRIAVLVAGLLVLVWSVAGLVVRGVVGLEVKEFVVAPVGHGCVATGVIFKGGHRESSPKPPPPPPPPPRGKSFKYYSYLNLAIIQLELWSDICSIK